ncbi:MAG TPA: VIT1/CCC1 transporter family protein [Myxococcota bacterium]|nr:VIT1/CCC1 transporter family protein [Myxococcota bacterium]
MSERAGEDEGLEHEHTPEAIRSRLRDGPELSYLREWVYGSIDGVVTTFAIVAGVTGASLSPMVVVILGVANLVGDGFSMAASAFSSTRAERESSRRLREVERRHIAEEPEGEQEEIRQIYREKGLEGEALERVVRALTQDRDVWVDVMMREEYGVGATAKPPLQSGLHTFLAFVTCGAVPLLPFFVGMPAPSRWALALSAGTFFAIGSFKSRWTVRAWWRQGLETLAVGLTAAGLAFAIGYGLRSLGLET